MVQSKSNNRLAVRHLKYSVSLQVNMPATKSYHMFRTTSQSAPLSEEEFLDRLEAAIDGAGGSSLRPLHDLTPLVWEVAAQ